MPLLNTGLLDQILPGDTNELTDAGGIDISQVIAEVLPSLHADSPANLTYWTEPQLIQWMDESMKRLSAIACVFVGRTVSLTVQGQAAYSLPVQHVSTLHVSIDSTALRPSGTLELEARDSNYQTAQGTPDHWYEDLLALASLGLAPVPDSQHSLAQIYEGWPTTLSIGQTTLAAPAPLKGYLAMYVLAEAYGMEGESEMPDVAAHCRGRLAMYHDLFQHYYGSGT